MLVMLRASARSVTPAAGMAGRLAWTVKMVTPFLFTSTRIDAPTGAEPTLARTDTRVMARLAYHRKAPRIGALSTPWREKVTTCRGWVGVPCAWSLLAR